MDVRKLTGLCAFGGALLTALDQVHVRYGVVAYPKPFLFGQAWWVPLAFTAASLVALLGWRVSVTLTDETQPALPSQEVEWSVTWLLAVYMAAGMFKDHPWLTAAGLALTFAARAGTLGSRAVVLQAVVMAAAGTLAEVLMVRLGLFRYLVSDVAGVPVWLPGIYLHGAFLVRALAVHHEVF